MPVAPGYGSHGNLALGILGKESNGDFMIIGKRTTTP
jgi:hypothetical protein